MQSGPRLHLASLIATYNGPRPLPSHHLLQSYFGGHPLLLKMAIAESMVDNASFDDCPPFPNNVPTCPLLRISLKKLLEGDAVEQDRLWSASCDVGFFYLDLRTGPAELVDENEGKYVVDGEALIEEADRITKEVVMAKDGFFNLPLEEKVKYDANFEKSLFG